MPSATVPPSARTATGRSGATAKVGIALVLVAQLMFVLDALVVNVALPQIARRLHFTSASLTWVLNGYTLAFGGLLLLGGRLGDVFGRRRTFVLGLAVFSLFSLAGGLAPTADLLVLTRAFQGAGAAIAAPQVLALLMTSAGDDPGARGRALALFAAVTGSGASIGLILGGFFTDIGSWRWVLFINVPIGLAVLACVRRYVAETARRRERFDVAGAVLAVGGAALIVWSLINAPEQGWSSARTLGGLALGLVLLAALVVVERRVAHPLLRVSLFSSRRRVGAYIAWISLIGAQFSLWYLSVLYLQDVLDLGPLMTGFAFLPLALATFAMSRVAPRLAARIKMPGLLLLGTIGMTVSFVWLAQLNAHSTYAGGLLVPFIVDGAFAALLVTGAMALGLELVDPAHAGAASGMMQTLQQLGGSIGLAVITSVYVANGRPGSVLPGMHEAFLAAAILGAVGIVSAAIVMARSRRPRRSA